MEEAFQFPQNENKIAKNCATRIFNKRKYEYNWLSHSKSLICRFLTDSEVELLVCWGLLSYLWFAEVEVTASGFSRWIYNSHFQQLIQVLKQQSPKPPRCQKCLNVNMKFHFCLKSPRDILVKSLVFLLINSGFAIATVPWLPFFLLNHMQSVVL